MSADFTPNMESYKNPHYFRFWCQKVLPLVYDDSLSYYELLCKVVKYLNDVIEDSDAMKTNIGNLLNAYNDLQAYVNDYFDNLDVQNEINNKLDQMAESGELSQLLYDVIGDSAFPRFVSSVDEMTDHNIIYVLASTGDIYYYNGTEFINSGIEYGTGNGAVSCYNRLVSPSTISDIPFSTFDDAEKNRIYAYVGNSEEYFGGVPDIRYNGILIDFGYSQTGNTGRLQVFKNRFQSWFRINWANNWSDWVSESPSSEIYITADNYASYSDIRTLKTNNVYAIAENITSNMVANLPVYNRAGVLYKVNMDSNESSDFAGEILLYIANDKMYFQEHFGTLYSGWLETNSVYPYGIGVENNYYGFTSFDDFTNGTFNISDPNNVLANAPKSAPGGTLLSFSDATAGIQIFYSGDLNTTRNNRSYIRYKWARSWGAWRNEHMNCFNLWGNGAIQTSGLPANLNDYFDSAALAIASTITSDALANLPIYGQAGILIVIPASPVAKNGCLQIFVTHMNTAWFRICYGADQWFDWIGVGETGYDYYINTIIDKPFNLTASSKILTFGDSITAGYPVGASKAWPALVANKLGCQLENKAVSQARFDESQNNSIMAQIESVTDWETITHIFIAAGVNDASQHVDITLFRGYVQNAINEIREHTQAPIVFITPIERANTQNKTTHYSSIINTVALANDCSVINGYDIPIPFNSTEYYNNLTGDGIHPTETGQKVYARYVLNCVM